MIYFLLILFIITSFYLFTKQKAEFLYTLLALNFVIDILGAYFDRGGILAITRAAINLGFIVWFSTKYSTKTPIAKLIFIWIIYQICLLPFSSDIVRSVSLFIKDNIPFVFFIIAFRLGSNNLNFHKLYKVTLFILIAFIVNTLLSTFVFKLGGQYIADYEDDDFSTGNIYGSALTIISYGILLVPVLQHYVHKKRRSILFIISVVSIIFLVVSLRRTTVILLVIGFGVYLFSMRRYLAKIVFYVFLFSSLVAISFPLFEGALLKRYDVRSDRFEEGSLEKEARTIETLLVFGEIFSFTDIKYSFFGREIYNSPGNYADGLFGPDRMIHVDYTNIANGQGIIGLLLYILIFIYMLSDFLKYKKSIRSQSIDFALISSSFVVFWISILANSLAGGMHAITHRSFALVVLGLLLGFFKSHSISNRIHNSLK